MNEGIEEAFEILKLARKALKLTQEEVAVRVGVTRQVICLWEVGKLWPTMEHYELWKEVIIKAIKELRRKKERIGILRREPRREK